MTQLEKFYNEKYLNKTGTPFKDLSDEDKIDLSDTLSFAVWKLLEAINDEINKSVKI